MIREITTAEAKRYYRRYRETGDRLSFSEKGRYYGYFKKNKVIGIVSTQIVGKRIRIKTLSVSPDSRGKGIGAALLGFLIYDGLAYSAFASEHSIRLFEKFGFTVMSESKNGIKYMKLGGTKL